MIFLKGFASSMIGVASLSPQRPPATKNAGASPTTLQLGKGYLGLMFTLTKALESSEIT